MAAKKKIDTQVKIKLIRDLEFPYSGRAFITHPVGSTGFLLNMDEELNLTEEEKKEITATLDVCKTQKSKPAVVNGKLISVAKNDYEEV